jgi:ankyrin repeat protein
MKKLLALLLLSATPAMAGMLEDRLAEAVRGNDVAAARSLLARHANPNLALPDKSTALTWAVDRQNPEMVRLLLAAGAKTGHADFQGATPLVVACQLGNPDIVISLLKAGANAKAARPDGVPAFALCAGVSAPAALEAMLAKGAGVNLADTEGVTPLMRAAANGNADDVKFLASHGANVNAVAKQGFTALFFAVKSRDARAPMILLEAGADAKAVLPADGTSVAEAAVLVNNEAFARTLVTRGVDLAKADAQGRQLIHVAAAGGYPELVKLLLSKGVDANVLSTPPAAAPPRRPTQVAAAAGAGAGGGGGGGRGRGGLAVADGALKAPPVTLYPTPPLLFAARTGQVATMKTLVAGGARIDGKASDGMTLALAAAYSGNLAALQYALELNPDLATKDNAGRGLMHMAVSNPEAAEPEKVVTYLLEKGLKLDAKDGRGRMPADSVTDEIREFYLALLKEHGIAPDRLGPADAGNAQNAAN